MCHNESFEIVRADDEDENLMSHSKVFQERSNV